MGRRASGKRKRGRCSRRAKQSSSGLAAITTTSGLPTRHAKRVERRLKRKEQQEEAKEKEHTIADSQHSETSAPHSFVFSRGQVGKHIHRLVKDMRHVMEPYTASRLKAQKRNNLKDFIVNATPVGVTDLLVFTRTEKSLSLRLIKVPQGPTITFKVEEYTLSRDVLSKQKKPPSVTLTSQPLVVLNNFDSNSKHLNLAQSVFQNMFPALKVDTLNLNTVRRCVLINYNKDSETIDLRHYKIKTVPTGLSRSAKKLVQNKVPNMNKYKDISEYFLDPGQMSESEYEMDQQEIDAPPLNVRGVQNGTKTNVRLLELGPRLNLRLIKIEEGICDGEVLYHAFKQKTREQIKEQRLEQTRKRKIKQNRKLEQERNVIRKIKEREEHKQKCLEGIKDDKSSQLHNYKRRLEETVVQKTLGKRKREREQGKPQHKRVAKEKRSKKLRLSSGD